MDPSELRMNLASLQRIDPYIAHILMASSQVALYKYVETEWEKTNIEGTLFVYERKCEPCFGFLILNRLSTNNKIQPITKDIELQDKSPFLLYKTKESIHGIWFYEKDDCQKLFQRMEAVISKLRNSDKEVTEQGFKQAVPGVRVGTKSNNGEISLVDLLNNAGNKGKPAAKPSNHETSPSGGEKLLRLLSVSEQRNDENKENGGGSVAAFFAQVSQASNTTSGPPPPGLPAATQPRMDPLQSLLFTDPAVVSVDKQPQSTGPMPPLPVAAKAASDLESDLKPTKAKKAVHGANKTPNKSKPFPVKPVNGDNLNNGSTSYASVTAAAKQMVQQQQQPAPPMETTVAPQLMSPMVFAGQGQDHQPSPGPAAVPVRAPPMGLPVITPVSIPVSMPLIAPPVMPFNGVPAFHMPVHVPQVTPLTEAQLTQAFQHLLQTDRGFVTKIHQAYVESLNTQLN